jgi:hypothetical protein
MSDVHSFRVIQPDERRGYSGLTAIILEGSRELVAMGVGADVEQRLRAEVAKRK